MDNIIRVINNRFKGKIGENYYNSYCILMQLYENAMEYLCNTDKNAFDIFCNWFVTDGMDIFSTIFNNIQNEKLNSRFNAFMEAYGMYLESAVEDDCKQAVLDFLYIIPKKMEKDFYKFGFLESKKYVWEYKDSTAYDDEYPYFWKPDNDCQVLLVY